MKNTRKGFTLVELVIVIAVIAILAAVLIPTFGGIIDKANESSALQQAKNAYTEYLGQVDYAGGETAESSVDVKVVKGGKTYYFTFNNGAVATPDSITDANLEIEVVDGVVTIK